MKAWQMAEIRRGIILNAKDEVISAKESLEVVHLFMIQGSVCTDDMVKFLERAKTDIDEALAILKGAKS